jgi:hypothetical protein
VRQGSGRALFVRIGSMHMGLQLRSLRRLAVGSLLSVAGLMFAQDGSLQGLLAAHQYAETLRGADVQLQARREVCIRRLRRSYPRILTKLPG